MTNTYSFVLTLLFTILASTLSAQQVNAGNGDDDMIPIGAPLAPGSFVPNELILRLDQPMADPTTRDKFGEFIRESGAELLEWSPSFGFLRVGNIAFDVCEIINGDGKPLGDAEGQGQNWTWGLNYSAGTLGWVSEETLPCGDPTFDPLQGPGPDTEGYSPVRNCEDWGGVLPETGSGAVRVAIIDSGIRGAGTQGYINGVRHRQTIIPENCNGQDCAPITSRIHEYSRYFHEHGKLIAHLLSGWFRANDMQDQLDIHSYHVLNQDLQCNVFQVVKAIELATDTYGAHLINLSIGFTPVFCEETGGTVAMTDENILRNAIRAAEEKGVIVIAAAGNSSKDLAVSPEYPAAERGLENLVVVGAQQCGDKERTSWSNYGAEFVDVFTLGSRVKIPGYGCDQEVFGTSFATPIVTAKAAFHITKQEEYDPKQVLCLLRSQTEPLDGATYGFVSVESGKDDCAAKRGNTAAIPGRSEDKWGSRPLELSASPNPFGEELNLLLPDELSGARGTVSVLNGNGRLVRQHTLTGQAQRLEFVDLKPGVYWLRVVTDKGNAATRIVKQ